MNEYSWYWYVFAALCVVGILGFIVDMFSDYVELQKLKAGRPERKHEDGA